MVETMAAISFRTRSQDLFQKSSSSMGMFYDFKTLIGRNLMDNGKIGEIAFWKDC
jgi:hypothetical protein